MLLYQYIFIQKNNILLKATVRPNLTYPYNHYKRLIININIYKVINIDKYRYKTTTIFKDKHIKNEAIIKNERNQYVTEVCLTIDKI